MASSPITSWQIDGAKVEIVSDFIFLSSKINADGDCSHKTKRPAPWKNSYDKSRQWDITLLTKFCIVKAMVFPIIMYEYESWTIKKAEHWCFWTVVLEKALESPLDCKEIQPVHSKGNQLWIFIGKTGGEVEVPILWAPDAKSWLIGKEPDTAKDWAEGEKGVTEDEMVGWHHWFNGLEL